MTLFNHKFRLHVLLMLLMAPIYMLEAQSYSIGGSSTAYTGDTNYYTLCCGSVSSASWSFTGNGIVNNGSGTGGASLTFNNAGTKSIDVTITDSFYNYYYANKTVTVSVKPPGNPTISSNNCGTTVLQRSGSPTNGDTWYWQGKTASGTSTTKGSGSTYTANEGNGTYYIRARSTSGEWSYTSGSVSVTTVNFTAGSINGAQTICYSGDPSTLGNASSPGGGSGGYTYQWQSSTTGTGSWSNISGATGTTYDPPSLTSNRWYRRRVISCGGTTLYSNIVKVTVEPNLSAGTISNSGPGTICYNGNPSNFTNATSASGGTGSYSYQWQYSNNGSSGWTNISGATSASYDAPSGLTADRWYRRRVISCQTKYTSSIHITVNPALTAGSINGTDTICYNEDPLQLNSVSLAGGGDGNYTYQWQHSPNNASWYNVTGATSASYNPGPLTETTYFRRNVNSCGQFANTSTVLITVNPQLTPGSISDNQTICYNSDPVAFEQLTAVSGGDGNYSYQWQYSNDGTSGWTNISGATGITYDSGPLTTTRYFRRKVVSCNETKYTSEIVIVVQPDLLVGSISNSGDDIICYGGNPDNLASITAASGGDGIYSYQWQYSNDGSSGWTNISGATAVSYDPPAGLTADRWYRRRAISCGQTKYTGSIPITVNPSLNAGSINGAQSICSTEDPAILGSSSLASGGDGTYSYQWQYSDNGTSGWTNISAATSTTYNPGILGASRWYRRVVSSCGETKNTASIEITVTVAQDWYADIDGDNYAAYILPSCTNPGTGFTLTVLPVTDCNDNNASINAGTVWYLDADGDGLGDPNNASTASCIAPANYVANDDDLCPSIQSPNNDCQAVNSSTDKNYVYSREYWAPRTSAPNFFTDNASDSLVQNITYFDGLGRASQQVGIDHTPNRKDIINAMDYDDYGRIEKEYLPYATTDSEVGTYRTSALTDTEGFYYVSKYDNTENPYSQKLFEKSPLNRVEKQAAPGASWEMGSGKEIKMEYYTNTSGDGVRQFEVSLSLTGGVYVPTLGISSANGGLYYAGELFKKITKDENWQSSDGMNRTVEEFTDKNGRVILKRTYADMDLNSDGDKLDTGEQEVIHDTYYVYDNYGNLTFVLPPAMNGATETLTSINNNLDALGYQYTYDSRNRLAIKQLPGKGEEYIIYNKLDQPIMTQDANMRGNNKWLFTVYDAFGRVAYTGIDSGNSNTRATEQSGADAESDQFETKTSTSTSYGGTDVYYTNTAYPTSIDSVYTINYYDNYNFDLDGGTSPGTVYGESVSSNVNGLATGSKVRVLGTNDWITTVTYYDVKGRPVYVYSKNTYLSTVDVVESKLDFSGKALETTTTHTKGTNPAIVIVDAFSYDHVGRLLTHEQTIGSNTEVIVQNVYDDLGVLDIKKVGNTISTPLQTVDYMYNIRGWLTKINDPASLGSSLFGFKINYDNVSHGATALFNGNIAETEWKTQNDNVLRWYGYEYDELNRINTATDGSTNADYSLVGVSYDKNGNILTLERNGHLTSAATSFGQMDDLVYLYSGNQLLRVTDQSLVNQGFNDQNTNDDDYRYDVNGNLLMDRNKYIGDGSNDGIAYNHLNLPVEITVSGGGNNGTIDYIYDATGVKLQKVTTDGSSVTTDYAGNFIYEDTGSGPILQFFNHPEGYVEPDGSGGYDYVYQYKDHLGNVRLSYSDGNGNGSVNVSTEVLEENSYYPFGLKHQGYNVVVNSTNPALKVKFGGKELDESLDLNTYDFGARNYDAAIGRWMNVDPKAYKYFSYSPYNYAINSPLIYVDPNGEELYVAGNRKERRQLYREIKKLTNNRLKLNRKTGEVTIRNGRANNGKDLRRGTELLTSIISKKDQRVTAITRENANEKFGLTGSGNQTIKGSESNSIGEGNAVVAIDFNDTGEGVTNEDGSNGRPLFIGVAHELIHGDRIINGKEEEGTGLSENFIDPDTPELGPGGDPRLFHDEEMAVREVENLIRNENKIIKRANPIFVNPNKELDEFLKKINNGGN